MVDSIAAQTVIANPLSQDIATQVTQNLVVPTDVAFSFRTTKVDDPAGGTVVVDGKEGPKQVDWKRPTNKVPLPLVTVAGVIAGLQAGDKTTQLIVDSVNEAIINRYRGLINEKIESDPSVVLAADTFDLNTLTLAAIAAIPKGERGAGIPKEQWANFVTDYKATMQTPEAIALFPDKQARSPEVLDKHGILLAGKFNQIRSRKDTAGQMLGFLDIWVQTSKNLDENLACYEHLKAKGEAIQQAEDFNDL